MKALLKFAAVVDRITEWQGWLSALLVIVVILVGFYNVVTRYIGQWIGITLSSNAYIELQWYLFSAIFFFGFAYVLKHHINVRVDFFYSRWSRRNQARLDFWGTILFLIPFCILGLYVTVSPVMRSWITWEMSSDANGLPRAPVKSLVVIAFTFLLIQSLAQAIKYYAIMQSKLPESKIIYEQEAQELPGA
ncbi:MAG TPA: TRAP transporter small permease subunit [Caldilineaceae bacterium]|nr:TRAP transporter small permease subunit [Caldilineaceae bacterium]HRW08921.1 TRAP transporter small permease subunit [Caldilineaceae bacterium]